VTIRKKRIQRGKAPRLHDRAPLRIAIDSGGTFTDCVWLEDSTLRILKVFSTPSDPSQAIAGAVQKISP